MAAMKVEKAVMMVDLKAEKDDLKVELRVEKLDRLSLYDRYYLRNQQQSNTILQ